MAKRFLTPLNLSPQTTDPATGSEGDAYFNADSNKIRVYYDGSWNDLAGGGGSSSNSFETINVPNGTDPVADTSTDTLNITESNGIIVTGTSSSDSIEFSTNATPLNTALTIISRDEYQAFDITGIDFDTVDTITAAVGRVAWDDGEGTLSLGIKGGNVNLKVGQSNIALCYNGTGSIIPKAKVVYIDGAQGQRPRIALSDADTEVTSSKTFGLTSESIGIGAEGYVTTFGIVENINTLGLTEGAALWLSSTSGEFTTTMPVSPAHSVFLGYCIKAHATAGRIFVSPRNGFELYELHDVQITSIADNHIISYDNATSLWKNQALVDAIKEVDGSTSGIDADLLDGEHGSYYLDWTNTTNKPDPTITLGGDLSGSITLTDLAGGTLSATINANAVELGTDTTGQYVSSISGTLNEVEVNTSGTENLSVTISLPTTINANTTGNAATATTLASYRTIELTGDITGSTSFNGSGDVTIGTTIGANSVALGTDTTGNYVATIAGTTNQIEVLGAGTEGRAATLSFPSSVTFPGEVILNADPTQSLGAATKQYVDAVAQGLHIHASAQAATTSNITSFSSPPASIDGVTLLNNMRVLVKDQTTTSQNGVYVYTTSPTALLSRATDFDTPTEIHGGDFIFVTGGTTNNDTGWVQTEIVSTVGVDPILFQQFSGAGTYTAGTGITLTGNQFSNAGVLSVNGSTGAITGIAALSGPTFTGTVTIPTLSLTTADSATTASHYFIETASDGIVRPKTLANVRTEIVTTAAVNSAAATTVGTITSGIWNGSSISTTYTDAKVTSVNGSTGAITGLATTAATLAQFAATTSAQLAGIISDETGFQTGADLVFNIGPTINSLTGSSNYAMYFSGGDNQGGTGYFDFIKVTNTGTGATNPNKSFRLNSTGALEIINSAYTTTIFSMTDTGNITTVSPTAAGSNGVRNITVSTSTATGGSDGDVWLVYV